MYTKDWLDWVSENFDYIKNFSNREYLNNKNMFIKGGKLSIGDTLHYILIQKGRSNSIESYDFYKNFKNNDTDTITASAIGQKRAYIMPEVFIDLNKKFVDGIYADTTGLPKFKDYTIISCDGSDLALPNSAEVKEAFNIPHIAFSKNYLARRKVSCTVDSYTRLILDCTLNPKGSSEPELAIEHIKNLSERINLEKTITLYDRGYNSIKLILEHFIHGSYFVIRSKISTFKNERKLMESNDEIIQISLAQKRTGSIEDDDGEIEDFLKNTPYINLRITEVELESGETECLLSNLPIDEFTASDLKELYNKRWKIETTFDFLKNVVNIENFTARREMLIRQDFYASILFYNISMALKQYVEYCERIANRLKKDYAINYNVTAGILKEELWNILQLPSKSRIKKLLQTICNILSKMKVKINRTQRKDMEVKTSDKTAKYHLNKRRAMV